MYDKLIIGVTDSFLPSMLKQTIDERDGKPIPTVEEYLDTRADNYAWKGTWPLFELDDPLPEEIRELPILVGLVKKAGLLVSLANVSQSMDQYVDLSNLTLHTMNRTCTLTTRNKPPLKRPITLLTFTWYIFPSPFPSLSPDFKRHISLLWITSCPTTAVFRFSSPPR